MTIKQLVDYLGFEEISKDIYRKHFSTFGCEVRVNFKTKTLIYPEAQGLVVNERQTCDFRAPENFVVFECVYRLLSMGYSPTHIELEPKWKVGHGASGGRADILVKDKNDNAFLIIECKVYGTEFENEWRNTLNYGGQLFTYARQTDGAAKFVILYSSTLDDDELKREYKLIALRDKGSLTGEQALFLAWKDLYNQEYDTIGVFEDACEPYEIGKSKRTIANINPIKSDDIHKKYHEFATILRQHSVSGRENAFDKLVNLFLAKIIDEKYNVDDLWFAWKNASDDYYSLHDRIQKLYRRGMEEFLKEDVTYIDNDAVEDAFRFFKNDPDATKETTLSYFRQLKFYTNSDFAFIDVHNESLFFQNSVILLKVIRMLQDIKLKAQGQNQFLGDLFEGFLDQGIKQSEGQFFTPVPIVKFLVSSLPLKRLIENRTESPKVIDYACGSGHFLNEYATQIRDYVDVEHLPEYYSNILGIEKEYRLSKVAKVSAFMYGQDEIQIINADALASNSAISDGSFDILISNPPYSVKGFLETLSEDERTTFEIIEAIEAKGIATNNSIEVFFIERAKQLLAPGGVAAIILPSSILSNSATVYIRTREILLKYFDIVAIAEFGSGTFGKTGTNTVTLFLRRKEENPSFATHYQNRVNAWFNGDFNKDHIFEDADLLSAYCMYFKLDIDDYKTLLLSTPNNALLETDTFKMYKVAFDKLTEIRQLCNKQYYKKMTSTEQKNELHKRFIYYARKIELEKLYYFILAYSNPQPVVVVKSPSNTAGMKRFLGYEWSSAKGSEGIKYLGVATVDENGEPIIGNKGINGINTPLFNPSDLVAADKINTIIRENFNGVSIGESEFVTRCRLVDMLDFSGVKVEKAISLSLIQTVEIISRYPLIALADVASISRGASPRPISSYLTTSENGVNWIKIGDVGVGEQYITKTKEKITQEGASKSKLVNVDDIIISNSMSAGRPYILKISGCIHDGWLLMSNISDRLDKKYFYHVLCSDSVQQQFSAKSLGGVVQNMNTTRVAQVLIPLPPLNVQRKIVAECETVNEEYNRARMSIEEYRQQATQLFTDIEHAPVERCKLSDVVSFNPSKAEIANISDDTIVSFVEMASVSNDGYIDTMVERPLVELRKNSYTYFCENDIILAKITPCMENGKCAIAEGLKNGIGMGSSEFHVIRCGERINKHYLFGFLNRQIIRVEAEKQMTGASGHRRVPISFYRQMIIPVPALEKQLEVAAALMKIYTQIAAAKFELDKLENCKQDVLTKYLS